MPGLVEEIQKVGPAATYARVGVLVLLGVLMEVSVRVLVPRWTARIAQGSGEEPNLERAHRNATVVNFSSSVVRLVLWAMIFVSLLGEININIGPLLAGAGVLGAALAFGAQNIVRDYLAGVFILLENQFTLGDVIRIGLITGTVEVITMRITVLRGLDGALHVIPNGTIQAVSNLTRGWARALVDISISNSANLTLALDEITKAAHAFHEETTWRRYLLEPPEVLGVMTITETAMTLRVTVKVRAEEQWRVQRELLRRLKIALDARQIAPPTTAASPAPRA